VHSDWTESVELFLNFGTSETSLGGATHNPKQFPLNRLLVGLTVSCFPFLLALTSPMMPRMCGALPVVAVLRRGLTTQAAAHPSTLRKRALEPNLVQVCLFIAALGGGLTLVTAFVDIRVGVLVNELRVKLASVETAHKANLAAMQEMVDLKTATLASSVQKDVASMAISVQKEVDAKTAGLASSVQKEVDAKNAGLAREVDAKMASVVANAASKAEAETLRVFKDFKVCLVLSTGSEFLLAQKGPIPKQSNSHFYPPSSLPFPTLPSPVLPPDFRVKQGLTHHASSLMSFRFIHVFCDISCQLFS
jgi:hypothetical protein